MHRKPPTILELQDGHLAGNAKAQLFIDAFNNSSRLPDMPAEDMYAVVDRGLSLIGGADVTLSNHCLLVTAHYASHLSRQPGDIAANTVRRCFKAISELKQFVSMRTPNHVSYQKNYDEVKLHLFDTLLYSMPKTHPVYAEATRERDTLVIKNIAQQLGSLKGASPVWKTVMDKVETRGAGAAAIANLADTNPLARS